MILAPKAERVKVFKGAGGGHRKVSSKSAEQFFLYNQSPGERQGEKPAAVIN
jgi:hypothetical protein